MAGGAGKATGGSSITAAVLVAIAALPPTSRISTVTVWFPSTA
jgi:hypothetical protein